jgi:hypothetical protein
VLDDHNNLQAKHNKQLHNKPCHPGEQQNLPAVFIRTGAHFTKSVSQRGMVDLQGLIHNLFFLCTLSS